MRVAAVLAASVVLAVPARGVLAASGAQPVVAPAQPPPVVLTLKPHRGPTSGGTVVRVMGSGLSSTVGVFFGRKPAERFTVVSDSEVDAVSPPGQWVQWVTVVTPAGISASSLDSPDVLGRVGRWFAYQSAPGGAVPAWLPVTLQLSTGPPPFPAAARLGRWCPLVLSGPVPMAPLMCVLRAFRPATALWNQARATATVFVGQDVLQVTIGSSWVPMSNPLLLKTWVMAAPAELHPSGTTVVPLRFFAQLFNGTIHVHVHRGTASLTAGAKDAAMVQAEALLAVLAPVPPSQASTAAVAGAPEAVPPGPVVRDAAAEWLTPVSLPKAKRWVDEAAAAAARMEVSSWRAMDGQDPGAGVWATLTPSDDLTSPGQYRIEVSLKPASGGGGTSVRYDALVVERPPYEAASGPIRIPPGAQSVSITRWPVEGGVPAPPTVLTAPAVIADVARAVDDLRVIPVTGPSKPVVYSCLGVPLSAFSGVDLQLLYEGPHPGLVTVRESWGCFGPTLGGASVLLPDGEVFEARDAGLTVLRAAGIAPPQ